jgi:outer membrane biosynthesis protein TonB
MTTQPARPTAGPGSSTPAPFRATRTGTGVGGRAVLAALGLALAAAVLPATAVHASPQPPDMDNRFANPGGNPQPPEPPDPPQWGPQDLASPTEDPEPPPPPNPNPTSPADNPLPTPQRIDAGFGGTAAGAHHAAGLALIGAALVLAVLVAATARRHRSGAGSAR